MVQDVQVPAAGHYSLNVKAGASTMDGVGARMIVKVDGVRVLRTMVESESYRSHWAGLDATGPGTHRIVVKFTNDDAGGGEDRNLYVDRLAVWRR
jgi:hypothetical protein